MRNDFQLNRKCIEISPKSLLQFKEFVDGNFWTAIRLRLLDRYRKFSKVFWDNRSKRIWLKKFWIFNQWIYVCKFFDSAFTFFMATKNVPRVKNNFLLINWRLKKCLLLIDFFDDFRGRWRYSRPIVNYFGLVSALIQLFFSWSLTTKIISLELQRNLKSTS